MTPHEINKKKATVKRRSEKDRRGDLQMRKKGLEDYQKGAKSTVENSSADSASCQVA